MHREKLSQSQGEAQHHKEVNDQCEANCQKQDQEQQLQYILLNLRQLIYPPSIQQAMKSRQLKSNAEIQYSLTKVKEYYRYGPGITLYFALLRYLIICFIAVSIVSIPIILQNSNDDGLKMYYQEQNYKYDIMKFSLANQDFFQFPANQWTQNDNDRMEDVRDSQIQIIITDSIISIMLIFIFIYWNSHAKDIVKLLIQKQDKTLPSYYTLKMKNLHFLFKQQLQGVNKMIEHKPANFQNVETVQDFCRLKILAFLKQITKIYQDKKNAQKSSNFEIVQNQSIKIRFGRIKIEFVYNFEDFLQKLKIFTKLVQMQNQEQNFQKKQKLYQQIQKQYAEIKNIYINKSKINQDSSPNMKFDLNYFNTEPFIPIEAFITCATIEQKDQIMQSFNFFISSQTKMPVPSLTNPLNFTRYKRSIKQIKSTVSVFQQCQVEPTNILWQNYHLQDEFTLIKKIKTCCMLTVALFLALLLIFFINIGIANLTSTHIQPSVYMNSNQYKQNPHPSYKEAITSNNSVVIYIFCSELTSKTFQWSYYQLCSDYFTNFKKNAGSKIIMSFTVFLINFVLNKFIYYLAQKRRYRTLTQKQHFVIFNIFVVTLINSGILILLVRAQFADRQNSYSINSVSLLAFFRLIFPNIFINKDIQLYQQFNRRWYMQIGRQLIFNYSISLILAPWLILIYKLIKTKVKQIKATQFKCETQKRMNKLIEFSQFQLQSFYATTLVSVFFCLCYSSAIPFFYILAVLSLASIFFSSKVVFKYCSKKPTHLFDHLLNSAISRWLLLSLFCHQIFSILFLFTQDIFPQNTIIDQDGNDTIQHARSYVFQIFIYVFLMFMTLLVFLYYQPISDVLNQSQKELQQQLDQNKIQEFASYNSNGEPNSKFQNNQNNINDDLISQNPSKLSQSSKKKRKRLTKINKKQTQQSKDLQMGFSCKQTQNRLNINNDKIQSNNKIYKDNKVKKVKSVTQLQMNKNNGKNNKSNIQSQNKTSQNIQNPSQKEGANICHYLRSYKMQDNKQYHQISYTLMILRKLINQNQKLKNIKHQIKKQPIKKTQEIQKYLYQEEPIEMK